MSEQPVVSKEDDWKRHTPKSMWIHFTNICDDGKFKVQLIVDGKYHTIFEQYVDQNEGIVCESQNYSQWFR